MHINTSPAIKRYRYSRIIFLLSMMIIAAGLATSNSLMSWGQFGLVFAFILQGKYKETFKKLWSHRRVPALVAVYLLFVVGLVLTSNMEYGLKDLRIKLPLLMLPLFGFAFYPLEKKEYRWIFHSLLLGVMISIGTGFLIFKGIIPWKVVDMRSYSPFVSNVRLGTLLVFSIILCGYLYLESSYRLMNKYIYVILVPLFFLFLLLIQSLTGMVALLGTMILLSLHAILQKKQRKAGVVVLSVFLAGTVGIGLLVKKEYDRIYTLDVMETHDLPFSTPDGAIYKYDTLSSSTENGHYVWMYVSNWELKREWNKRSRFAYDSLNAKGWPVKGCLVRYLTSKGLKKNAETVRSLSDKEIRAIENGAINFLSLHPLDIRWRIHELWIELDEYKKTGDPNGKSFATRLETWKTAMQVFRENIWTGTGTGDVRDEMNLMYEKSGSKLLPEKRFNPHQQYLTTGIALGIAGLIIFIALIYYPVVNFRNLHILFLAVLSIAAIGMLDEDILETQAGSTQFIFIYLLTYMLHLQEKKQRLPHAE